MLSACGGSSGDSDTSNPIVAENSAPTISGVFATEAKAQAKNTVTLEASDPEGDTLNISIPDAPQWLSYSFENNQLELTIEPGFFDIAEHDIRLILSDGKTTAEYTYTVQVTDNPDQWQQLELTSDELQGSWSTLEENITFNFFENNEGVYLNGDELFLFARDNCKYIKHI